MVGFATALTRWVDNSRVFVISVVCGVSIAVFGIFVDMVRVCLTSVAVIVLFDSTLFVTFALVFLSSELTVLISVVAWLFAVVTC